MLGRNLLIASALISFASDARCSDRNYADIEAFSPSRKFRVDAKSPDNAKPGYASFQDNFVYTMTELRSGKKLWTRHQKMMPAPNPNRRGYAIEESPVEIFVSRRGWTVIRTGDNELVGVDIAGKDRFSMDTVDELLTEQERENHVSYTTAGAFWGKRLCYFLQDKNSHIFVIHTSWSTRKMIDIKSGRVCSPTPELTLEARKFEEKFTRDTFKRFDQNQSEWVDGVGNAMYFAGELGMKEFIPAIQKLELDSEATSSTIGGLGRSDWLKVGEVDPHSYQHLGIRSFAQKILRQLGAPVRRLPIYLFKKMMIDGSAYYLPQNQPDKFEKNLAKLRVGLRAREVLDLVGSPDDVDYSKWIYNRSDDSSVKLTWDYTKVTGISN